MAYITFKASLQIVTIICLSLYVDKNFSRNCLNDRVE